MRKIHGISAVVLCFTLIIAGCGGGGGGSTPATPSNAPTITSFTPSSGQAGDAVTITGTNLGSTQGTSVVKFNGTTATCSSWSATSLTCTVPSSTTTGKITVTTDNGTATSSNDFTIQTDAQRIAALHTTQCSALTSENITLFMSVVSSNFTGCFWYSRSEYEQMFNSIFPIANITSCSPTVSNISVTGTTATSSETETWAGSGTGSFTHFSSMEFNSIYSYSKLSGSWQITGCDVNYQWTPPVTFQLTSPTNHSLSVASNIVVTWPSVDPSSLGGYRVQVFRAPDAQTIIHDSGNLSISTLTYTIPAGTLTSGSEYKIYVQAYDNTGNAYRLKWSYWYFDGI